MTQPNDQLSENEQQQAIEHCLYAYHECLQTIAYDASRDGESRGSDVALLQDCADACLAATNAFARRSPNYVAFARLAAEIAAAASEVCSRLDDDDRYRVCYAATLRASMTLARAGGLSPREEREEDLRDRINQGSFPASDPPPGPGAV